MKKHLHRYTMFVALFVTIFALQVQAQNGPAPSLFSIKTVANGLAINDAVSVSADGTNVCVSHSSGFRISSSNDGGSNFKLYTTISGVSAVYSLYAVGGTLYAGTNSGLFISTNNGANFSRKTKSNNSLASDLIYGVYAVGLKVYAATPLGLSISDDGGSTFSIKATFANGLGSNNVRKVYAVGNTVYAATNSGLSISTNGGTSFSNKTTNNGLATNSLNDVYAVGTTVYAATNVGLGISTDGGANFINYTTTNGLGSNVVNDVYAIGNTVYAATSGGLSISTNGGTTFINYTTTNGLGSNTVNSVYALGNTVYAATSGGLSIGKTVTPTTTLQLDTIVYGKQLRDISLNGYASYGGSSVDGTFAFTNPNTVPPVGYSIQSYTFTPTDQATYSTVTSTVSVWVEKATPNVTVLQSVPLVYGSTLDYTLSRLYRSANYGGVFIPGNFAFTNPSIVPPAGLSTQSYTFTPTDQATYNTVYGFVILSINKATPTIMHEPWALDITYGQTLADSLLGAGEASVSGTFAFTTPSTAPFVGISNHEYTFTPDNDNYNTITGNVSVIVNEAVPTISAPAAISAIYNDGVNYSAASTSNSTGAITYSIDDTNVATVDENTGAITIVGIGTATITISQAADANYSNGTAAFSVTVAQATPSVTTVPIASTIIYGQTLADSNLTGGVASVDGTFAFTTPSTAPNAGTSLQDYTFTPTDTANYSTVTGTVSVTVSDVTTWSGTSWDFGTPNASLNAIIAEDYTSASFADSTSGPLIAKNLTVNTGKTVTVNAGTSVTIVETLVNNGTITVENNANLIQTAEANTNSGSGTAIVKRDSNILKRLDYTMWSSPVTGSQTLLEFSPLTSAASPVRFYTYNPAINLYSAATVTSPFNAATGYLIRMPNEKPGSLGLTTDYYKGQEAITYNGVFTGSLNNGTITLNNLVSDKYYSVGNPYPSTLSANAFLSGNATAGTLYFWRKRNGEGGSAYSTYTALGGAAGSSGIIPDDAIQVGQGFIVKTGPDATSLNFTNAMRETAPTSTQFLKTKKVADKSRLWLDLSDATGRMNQVLIGYLDGATVGFDAGIDGKYFNDSKIALTSIVAGEEYVIQGRPTFDASDVVALGFKTDVAGNYSIALNSFDGVFASGHDIYLLDAVAGKEIDLKTGTYSFAANAGVDNARFSLKYQKTLKVDAPAFNENSVKVYKNNGVIYVNSTAKVLKNIAVYDVQGRLITQQKNVNSTSSRIDNLGKARQMLIVKISAEDNSVVSKKVSN